MGKKQTYRNMALIHYNHLQNAVTDCIKNNHAIEKQQEVIAYTFSTLACIVAYADNYPFNEMSESILACKYAYNMLKHNADVITFVEFKGGSQFPMEFPVEFPKFEVKWEFQDFNCYHDDQKEAFKELFDDKKVIETLMPIMNGINNFDLFEKENQDGN